jgi:hypothetical protein
VLFVTLAVAPYFAYMRFGYDLFCTGEFSIARAVALSTRQDLQTKSA